MYLRAHILPRQLATSHYLSTSLPPLAFRSVQLRAAAMTSSADGLTERSPVSMWTAPLSSLSWARASASAWLAAWRRYAVECPINGSPGSGQLPPSPRDMIRRVDSAPPAVSRHKAMAPAGRATRYASAAAALSTCPTAVRRVPPADRKVPQSAARFRALT